MAEITEGGTFHEDGREVRQTLDGGYVVVGRFFIWWWKCHRSLWVYYVPNWIVKLNESGSIEWTKSLCGSMGDHGNCIQQTSDGGYIVAGGSDMTEILQTFMVAGIIGW